MHGRAGEFGRCYDDDRLAAVAGLGQLLFGRGRVVSPPQDGDPGIKIRFQAKGCQFGRWGERRLCIEADGRNRPYRDSDFVLLSITGDEARGDENLLPFYPLKIDALTAVWDGEDGVKRGKANLIAAYQQMRRSPDVTAAEASRLFDTWLQEFDAEKRRAEQVRSMPVARHNEQQDPLTRNPNEAVRRLAL